MQLDVYMVAVSKYFLYTFVWLFVMAVVSPVQISMGLVLADS